MVWSAGKNTTRSRLCCKIPMLMPLKSTSNLTAIYCIIRNFVQLYLSGWSADQVGQSEIANDAFLVLFVLAKLRRIFLMRNSGVFHCQ